MNLVQKLVWLAIAVLAIMNFGCSGSSSVPALPDVEAGLSVQKSSQRQVGNHLWGYYDCWLDVEAQKVIAVPNRTAMFSANVVDFTNMSPANIFIKIFLIEENPTNIRVVMNIGITHPFPGMPEYNGYDVRAIFIGEASHSLQSDPSMTYSDRNDDQFVLNPNGYTRWFNPEEFQTPGLFGYTKGILATPGYTGDATLNPFIYYTDGLHGIPESGVNISAVTYLINHYDDRGVFSSGTTNYMVWNILFPKSKNTDFSYAIMACWAGEDPQDHPANAEDPLMVIDFPWDNTKIWYEEDTGEFGGKFATDIYPFNWYTDTELGVLNTDYEITIEGTFMDSPYTLNDFEMTPTDNTFLVKPTFHVEFPVDTVASVDDEEYWVIVKRPGYDYTNEYGIQNDAWTDTLTTYMRRSVWVYEEEQPIHENFNSEPEGWYYGTYTYSALGGAGGPDPDYTTNSPYLTGAYGFPGNIRFPPVGNYVPGGVVATVVTPPWKVPEGWDSVSLRVYGCLGAGDGDPGYWGANVKIAVSDTNGLAPFLANGKIGPGVQVLQASPGSYGSWLEYDTQSLNFWSSAMAGQPAWTEPRGGGAFPQSLDGNWFSVSIPEEYHGEHIKIAFQFQTDEFGWAGVGTGFALDGFYVFVN